ncbi:hypothetical protein ACFQZ4_54105 [Catellatospora coxensis]|uniref:Gas vesicle protein n=1 Tax=Catellatospora coxensis TaxID=310354 RepID=A0A8J3LEM6_9ACTN|nr:hypothetical protein [Catellatospora coxensis]GIG11310.1 gas vesicle protein [Catellatospora coxensis]
MTEVQEVEEVGGDHLLRILAGAAQELSFKMSMTVNIGGATVLGVLIGRDVWVEELTAVAAKAGPGGQSLGESFQGLFQSVDLNRPADEEPVYGYLHLRDARYLSGGAVSPQYPNAGFLWRGRISEINGWTLGSLSQHLDT